MSENLVRYMPLFTAEEKKLIINLAVETLGENYNNPALIPFFKKDMCLERLNDRIKNWGRSRLSNAHHLSLRNKLIVPHLYTPFWKCNELFRKGPDNE